MIHSVDRSGIWNRAVPAALLLVLGLFLLPPIPILSSLVIAAFFSFVFAGHPHQMGWLAVGVFLAVMLVLIPSGSAGTVTVMSQGRAVAGLTCGALSGLLFGILLARGKRASRPNCQ